MHIVPLPSPAHPNLPAAPSVHEALAIVRSAAVPTAAAPAIEAAIRPRIRGFPAKAAALVHRARMQVWDSFSCLFSVFRAALSQSFPARRGFPPVLFKNGQHELGWGRASDLVKHTEPALPEFSPRPTPFLQCGNLNRPFSQPFLAPSFVRVNWMANSINLVASSNDKNWWCRFRRH